MRLNFELIFVLQPLFERVTECNGLGFFLAVITHRRIWVKHWPNIILIKMAHSERVKYALIARNFVLHITFI